MSETPSAETKEIKFLDTGKFAEHKPWMEQVEVKPDDLDKVFTVSNELAKSVTDAGKAEYHIVDDEAAEVDAAEVDAETLKLAESLGNKNHGAKGQNTHKGGKKRK